MSVAVVTVNAHPLSTLPGRFTPVDFGAGSEKLTGTDSQPSRRQATLTAQVSSVPSFTKRTKREAEAHARELMDLHGFRRWYFRWNQSSTTNGLCRYPWRGAPGVIELSQPHARRNGYNSWYIQAVVMHEVAHAKLPGHQHDEVWAELNARLGGMSLEYDARCITTKFLADCPACMLPHGSDELPAADESFLCSRCDCPLVFHPAPAL